MKDKNFDITRHVLAQIRANAHAGQHILDNLNQSQAESVTQWVSGVLAHPDVIGPLLAQDDPWVQIGLQLVGDTIDLRVYTVPPSKRNRTFNEAELDKIARVTTPGSWPLIIGAEIEGEWVPIIYTNLAVDVVDAETGKTISPVAGAFTPAPKKTGKAGA